ncbi:hypothetical protein O7630_06700 [Micromonospora sp. WMMD718]|uniref:hypothetical protein n=1 Tax=unclassified Micromonospora TaxID=2617518 RepID=UPI000AFE6829|nr:MULTISPECIES: hypothetical protein [unclassified Micromonospora]MDG4750620.1 hypothetical protein [Micromonospora sp. WMMD718]
MTAKVVAKSTFFVAAGDSYTRIAEGQEYDANDPAVKANKHLFEAVAQPEAPKAVKATRARKA